MGRRPDTGRGASPFSRSGEPCTDLVYLDCPVCGRQIDEPFSAHGGPQAVTHQHSRVRNARLNVVPKDHKVFVVPDRESMEQALLREMRRAS